MAFKITIEETKTVTQKTGKEWAQIDTEEVERDRVFITSSDEPTTRIKAVFGYTPAIEKEVSVTREILSQTVDTLDVAKVIRAINNLD